MKVSSFIADKIRFKGRIAAVATAISAFVVVIAICVSAGFRKEIRSVISRIAVISETGPIKASVDSVKSLPLVEEASYAIARYGILRSGEDIEGALFMSDTTLSGMQITLPSKLVRTLGFKGDRIQAFFPSDKVKARVFEVVCHTSDEVELDCAPIVRTSEEALRRLCSLDNGDFNAVVIESSASESYEMTLLESMLSSLFPDADVHCLADGAEATFEWLGMIDANVWAILLLMTLVAAFNMISGFLILVMRQKSAIGTLKALGMSDKGIAEVFLRISARASAAGLAAGGCAAVALMAVQSSTHFLKLDPANYFLPYVPVSINPGVIIAALLGSWVVIVLLMLVPCRYISRIDPSKTIQSE